MTAAAGEHPTLPVLRCELHEARPEQATPRGRVIQAAAPAHARILLSPTSVLVTSDPARIDRIARQLTDTAAALRAMQRTHTAPDQPALFDLGETA